MAPFEKSKILEQVKTTGIKVIGNAAERGSQIVESLGENISTLANKTAEKIGTRKSKRD